jgi:hypothetical protein
VQSTFRVRNRFVTLRSRLRAWWPLAAAVLLAFPATANAQHGHGSPPPVPTAPREATQFDFLVGQWEVIAKPHVSGLAARIHGSPKLPGVWKAWRGLDGWGIEDQLRLTDSSGNPRLLSLTLRVWDASAQCWSQSALDVYWSKFTTSTAVWRDGEMHVTGGGTDTEGRAFRSRTRFHDIEADSFRMQQDRSYDDGRTWEEEFLVIEAKRVAAVAPR